MYIRSPRKEVKSNYAFYDYSSYRIARWIDRQKEQDEELAKIRHEQSIITAGVLACLKSLVGEKDEKEVKKAIQMIENHLNEEAHK